MQTEQFNFDLPSENIALRPAVPRGSARMLVVDDNSTRHCGFGNLADFLNDGDLLVFNDTRVIPGRLTGLRGEAKVQVTLHKKESDHRWRVFAKPAKKCKLGDRLDFDGLMATVEAVGMDGERTLCFDIGDVSIWDALAAHGTMPLPPYIASQRPVDSQDDADYQTMFAASNGAVAAPTAGLHFTPEMISRLEEKGVRRTAVTLHVGAGTFLPVKVDSIADHKMHTEIGEISQAAADMINETRAAGGRIVAVGTTSLRLLEASASIGGEVAPFRGETDIFISPGYQFKAVDILLTNFHLPKSTLFMLVSAFSGLKRMQSAYATAIEAGYRFYSYGDTSLLFPQKDQE